MTIPGAVAGNPELGWFSIDDMIWLAWQTDGNLLECHVDPRGGDEAVRHAIGWIDVTSGTKHKIVSRDPLTIEASILCAQGCGFHGFVRGGKWVPA